MAKRAPKRSSKTAPRQRDSELYLDSQAGMARLFGVTQKTVESWRASGAPDREPKKGWPVGAWVKWRIGMLQSKEEGSPSEELKKVQTELARVKLAEAKGEVIPIEESNRQVIEMAHWCAGAMNRAGSELASRIMGKSPAEVRKIVTEYFDQVRRDAVERGKR